MSTQQTSFDANLSGKWALILGASSGFGLATAARLAAEGMNLCLVHRDRRGVMRRIQPEFDRLKECGVEVMCINADALNADKRDEILSQLQQAMGDEGRLHLLLHSIALGNLKLLLPEQPANTATGEALAEALGISASQLMDKASELFAEGHDGLMSLAAAPQYPDHDYLNEEDFSRTIHAMGTSLVGWVCEAVKRDMFTPDARVLGLTSEGNSVAWKGYAAVAAAKSALESVGRALAVEMAPRGLRVNILQPGVTDTPALRAIPGNQNLIASARSRNPYKRLTTPDDVAGLVYLMCRPEAGWINGEVLRVDGGEHISGLSA